MIEIANLRFTWPGAARPVLQIDRFKVGQGEAVFLQGRSGSGKSTLLSAIAGVVHTPPGTLQVAGQDLARLRGGRRDRFRADRVGIIFQLFNLVPYLSALDNVVLPCRFSRLRRQRAEQTGGGSVAGDARRLLTHLGIDERDGMHARADELSVGQQQRVAAARALIGRPEVVLADEPTSALDAESRDGFIDLLLAECRAAGASLLFVSHDRSLARHFARALDFSTLNRVADGDTSRC